MPGNSTSSTHARPPRGSTRRPSKKPQGWLSWGWQITKEGTRALCARAFCKRETYVEKNKSKKPYYGVVKVQEPRYPDFFRLMVVGGSIISVAIAGGILFYKKLEITSQTPLETAAQIGNYTEASYFTVENLNATGWQALPGATPANYLEQIFSIYTSLSTSITAPVLEIARSVEALVEASKSTGLLNTLQTVSNVLIAQLIAEATFFLGQVVQRARAFWQTSQQNQLSDPTRLYQTVFEPIRRNITPFSLELCTVLLLKRFIIPTLNAIESQFPITAEQRYKYIEEFCQYDYRNPTGILPGAVEALGFCAPEQSEYLFKQAFLSGLNEDIRELLSQNSISAAAALLSAQNGAVQSVLITGAILLGLRYVPEFLAHFVKPGYGSEIYTHGVEGHHGDVARYFAQENAHRRPSSRTGARTETAATALLDTHRDPTSGVLVSTNRRTGEVTMQSPVTGAAHLAPHLRQSTASSPARGARPVTERTASPVEVTVNIGSPPSSPSTTETPIRVRAARQAAQRTRTRAKAQQARSSAPVSALTASQAARTTSASGTEAPAGSPARRTPLARSERNQVRGPGRSRTRIPQRPKRQVQTEDGAIHDWATRGRPPTTSNPTTPTSPPTSSQLSRAARVAQATPGAGGGQAPASSMARGPARSMHVVETNHRSERGGGASSVVSNASSMVLVSITHRASNNTASLHGDPASRRTGGGAGGGSTTTPDRVPAGGKP